MCNLNRNIMSIKTALEDAAAMVYMFGNAYKYRLSKAYSNTINTYKGSSTKEGNNPKAIKARRKKNKNKKTHRR